MGSRPAEIDRSDAREIVVTRIIDAPRTLVFHAFTDRAQISNWWGPTGFSTTTHEMDVRPEGVWRFTMHGPDGTDYPNRIVYREVEPPKRIVYDHSGAGHTDDHFFRAVITLDEREGKTIVTMRLICKSETQRENLIKFGAVEGGHQTLERLGQHLAETADTPAANRKGGPGPPVFEITRSFDAPRHLVWQAHSEAEHLRHWWGPKGSKLEVATFEFREGGLFHYAMRYSTGAEMWGRFFYREIVPPRRMVWLNGFATATGGIARAPFSPVCPLEMLVTVTFSAEGNGKTAMKLSSTPFGASADEQKFFEGLMPSMRQGFGGTYDQLDQHLARGVARGA